MSETTNTGSTGQTGTNPETPKQNALVAFILKVLKLGDDAKIDAFFDGQVKALNRDIKTAKQNISHHETNITNIKEDYEAKIEDSKENIKSAYVNLDLTRLGTNGSRNEYASEYWEQVGKAEKHLENLNSSLEKTVKYEEDEIEKYNKQIEIRQNRINKIQNFN